METPTQLSETLIHVGEIDLKNKDIKKLLKLFTEKETEIINDSEEVFEFFDIAKDAEEIGDKIIGRITNSAYEVLDEYIFRYLHNPENENSFDLKLNKLIDIKMFKLRAGKESPYGFDAKNQFNSNKCLSLYIFLPGDGKIDLEFKFQNLKLQFELDEPEYIIFPAYFTHAHKFLEASQDVYFLKINFFIGGVN
jgi:hypothetical protein